MKSYRVNLQPTIDLHQRIERLAEEDLAGVTAALTNSRTAGAQKKLGGRALPEVGLSALKLSNGDVAILEKFSVTLHGIVEKILDRVTRSKELVERYFPSHLRMFPHLRKTSGSTHWQAISRYDFILSPRGEIRLLELNTGCPGGFMILQDMVSPTVHGLSNVGMSEVENWRSINMLPNVIVDTVLGLERTSGLEPGLIAILNDENELQFELERTAEAFSEAGRRSRVIDARTLRFEDGRLYHGDDYISASFNKFRISTPDSPNHCWKRGFEERYSAFLEAQKAGAFVSVNNLCGMSIAEDKGLVGLFFDPQIRQLLSDEEIELIDQCVPWTARLTDEAGEVHGEPFDSLAAHVRQHKDLFVLKPANEGRGFGVLIGKETDQQEWDSACSTDSTIPLIVQQFVESLSLPVGNIRDGVFSITPTFMTVASAMARGVPKGFISRLSTEAVTNVAQHGFIQAIFVAD
jgi:hypothetical protein